MLWKTPWNHCNYILCGLSDQRGHSSIPYCLELQLVLYKHLVSFSGWGKQHNRHLTMHNRAPICEKNLMEPGVWSTVWESFIAACYCKFIVWIGRQAPFQGRVAVLFATTKIYKNGDFEPRRPFHSAQYLPDLLHECRQLSLEFIAWKALIQNFN